MPRFQFLTVLLAIAVHSALAFAAPALAKDVGLKVMSFNIRYSYGKENEAKPENNWTDAKFPRRERTIRVIRDYNPDLLGVQEARHLQIVDLREALPKYDFYGVARDDGREEGEYVGIFYLNKRFERIGAGSFWLSDTPEKPGTSFYKVPNAVPRMASWVKLRDKESGREFVLLNTHWDHISGAARRQSAKLIRERLGKIGEGVPTIVMGDLNSPEDAPATKTLIGAVQKSSPSGRGQGEGALETSSSPNGKQPSTLIDSYRALNRERAPNEATYNNWEGTTDGSRIDFILHSDDFKPTAAEIVRTNYDGHWPSDHYPVTATLQLKR
jgi:endonuclease/exonuclease/phosphatase family metal-dependent hydrolase